MAVQYVAAANAGHEQLWSVYGSKKACSERFELYVHKTKSLDRVFRKLRRCLPKGVPVVIGWGNARFKSGMAGCKPVPTSSMHRRIMKTMGEDFDVRGVDEFHTTKHCVGCGEELLHGKRWMEV